MEIFALISDKNGRYVLKKEFENIDIAMEHFLKNHFKISLEVYSTNGDITEYELKDIEDNILGYVSSVFYETAIQDSLTLLGYSVMEAFDDEREELEEERKIVDFIV
jgi:hypothetical protein